MADHETAHFLKQYVLRYAQVYFLEHPLTTSQNPIDALRLVLAHAYQGIKPDACATWLIGTEDCQLCDKAYADYQTACQGYSLPALVRLDVLDFEPTLMALLAPNIPILLGLDDLLVCPFGLLDIVAMHKCSTHKE